MHTLGAPKYVDVYVHDDYKWLNGSPGKELSEMKYEE